ncbi:T9SS type A sorting domain-containing protein [Adhaeribacter radiodurans]|uniref:T9SS type A sorting domain-containing protein n=1 Tax=Adhaeribacter radiodurans TaxID=2745197 RepID=A0A7L7LDI7_9BACT|nr:T9SS type A sorting domain-containing protein [Adhaeribacter radiodurans]QMU30764.1 T9SS type A sorting domain-containing protein [Adhaeribacter radiodurans]
MPVSVSEKSKSFININWQAYFWIYVVMAWLLPLAGFGQETCLLTPVTLEERSREASLIVEAEVIGQQAYWDAAHRNIYTRHTLQLYKLIKGSAPETLAIVTEGGKLGDSYHVFSGTLQLKTNDQGIFFLNPAPSKVLPASQNQALYTVYSSSQGFIRYNVLTQQATEPFKTYSTIMQELYPALRQVTQPNFKSIRPNPSVKMPGLNRSSNTQAPSGALRTQAAPAISSFTPDTLTAGTGSLLTIRGSNFGSTRGAGSVQFRNADDGGGSFIDILAADYIFWTDTEIQVRVPGKNGSNNTPGSGDIQITNNEGLTVNSTQRLVIEYSISQVVHEDALFSPRLVNSNGLGGYTFQFAPDFAQNEPAKSAFTRALNTWSCHTGINWNTGTVASQTVAADDDINLVCFDEDDELPRGVLARCISRYSGCGDETADQWRVAEMDVVFNQSTRWNYSLASPQSLQVDFETVTLHEMGHGHQLNHVIKPGTVMHYAVNRGQENRILDARTDIAGGQFTMAQNVISNQCGPGRMIPQPVTNCSPATESLTFAAEVISETEVRTTWTLNNNSAAYFVVERSKDAATWHELSTINVSGTSTPYSYSDLKPLPGVSYYRLKVVSANQIFAYSPIARISREVQAGVAIAPNPVEGNTLWLQYVTQESGQLQIYVYDVVGRLHRIYNRAYQANSDLIDLDVSGLQPGLYVLVYADGRQTRQEKFLKL